jgi:hypothetical protein
VGLVGAGTFKVRIAVLTYGPTEVYFSPTCLATSSVVLVYVTPPLDEDTLYMNPCRSSDLPANFSLGVWVGALLSSFHFGLLPRCWRFRRPPFFYL